TDNTAVEPATAAADPVATNALPAVAHTESKQATPALAAELSALDAARSALAGGDTTGALSDLDAYARNFPRGRLGLEAEVLRIDALAKSGQTAAARKRAEAFMKRHPDSVLASRVRAYAGQ
ncbi:MAG TPA: tetratricopeptide repeat protein, partial [Polyangiaceae bacterium]